VGEEVVICFVKELLHMLFFGKIRLQCVLHPNSISRFVYQI